MRVPLALLVAPAQVVSPQLQIERALFAHVPLVIFLQISVLIHYYYGKNAQ
jgi:hypothetical protein